MSTSILNLAFDRYKSMYKERKMKEILYLAEEQRSWWIERSLD